MTRIKKLDDTALKNLKPGFYVLTQDVENPRPDRRSDSLTAKPLFPAGSRFFVRSRDIMLDDEKVGETKVVESFGGSLIMDNNQGAPQAEAIAPYLEPAPDTLGQHCRENIGFCDTGMLLAQLVENGIVTIPMVDAALRQINELDEEAYDEMKTKHWM
jgi:hypothetical protein